MRIIKIEIEHDLGKSVQLMKRAISLDYNRQPTIKKFIAYIKNICQLNDFKYVLELDGFTLSDNDQARALNEDHIYRLRILCKNDKQKKECVEESTQGLRSKMAQKEQKVKRKIAQKRHKQAQSPIQQSSQSFNSEQEEQQSSFVQHSEKQIQKINKKVDKKAKPPINNIKVSQQKQTIKQNTDLAVKTKAIKIAKEKSSSLDKSQQDQLPALGIINNKKIEKISMKPKVVKQSNMKLKTAIIQDYSSESEPSPERIFPKSKPKALPKQIDLHQKQSQNLQWLTVDKQKLKRWQEKGHKLICQAGNKIRFKIIEFDQERFIPVKSGWISGQVKSISAEGKVQLSRVQQQFRPSLESYIIPEVNMDELQIDKFSTTEQQLQCFSDHKNMIEDQRSAEPQEVEKQLKDNNKDTQSIQKYICGQINYYFSDKNYNSDLFMQMHANRHPEKYMALSFMLNFPKIKKVLRNVDKLIEYLRGDEKYPQRNFEIDFYNGLIRKKGAYFQPLETEIILQNLRQEQNINNQMVIKNEAVSS